MDICFLASFLLFIFPKCLKSHFPTIECMLMLCLILEFIQYISRYGKINSSRKQEQKGEIHHKKVCHCLIETGIQQSIAIERRDQLQLHPPINSSFICQPKIPFHEIIKSNIATPNLAIPIFLLIFLSFFFSILNAVI